MRLLVVTQYFWPENFRINDLVAELVTRGHEVVVLTGRPNYPSGEIFPEFRRTPRAFDAYAGAQILRVPIWPRGQGKLNLALNYAAFALSATLHGLSRLRSETFDATLVYEPSPVTVGLPAVALRRFKGWPIAFWVQDQWPETLSAVGVVKSPALLRLAGKLVSFIYRRCDLMLAQSAGLVDPIRKYCGQEQRVEYFPNWAETLYSESRPTPAPEIPAREDSFDILFAGNIGEAQDFPAILEAAHIASIEPRIRWLVVGDGRMGAWVKEEAARRGLSDRFVLLGRFPLERMLSFYAHAHALLATLRPDPVFALTLPGKVQSYLAAGKPILGMLDGEGAEVIRNAGAGLACPAGDARALAEAALRMSRLSPEELQRMGENGRAYSRREFDRDTLVSKLEGWLAGLQPARSAGVATLPR